MDSNGEVEWIMHIKGKLVIHMEVCNVAKGLWVGEEVVSPSGLLGAWSSTCVVTRGLSPCMCLTTHINKLVCVQGLLESIECGCVSIKVAEDKPRACRLQGHVG